MALTIHATPLDPHDPEGDLVALELAAGTADDRACLADLRRLVRAWGLPGLLGLVREPSAEDTWDYPTGPGIDLAAGACP